MSIYRDSLLKRIADELRRVHDERVAEVIRLADRAGVTVNRSDEPDFLARAQEMLDDEIAKQAGSTILVRLAMR